MDRESGSYASFPKEMYVLRDNSVASTTGTPHNVNLEDTIVLKAPQGRMIMFIQFVPDESASDYFLYDEWEFSVWSKKFAVDINYDIGYVFWNRIGGTEVEGILFDAIELATGSEITIEIELLD